MKEGVKNPRIKIRMSCRDLEGVKAKSQVKDKKRTRLIKNKVII